MSLFLPAYLLLFTNFIFIVTYGQSAPPLYTQCRSHKEINVCTNNCECRWCFTDSTCHYGNHPSCSNISPVTSSCLKHLENSDRVTISISLSVIGFGCIFIALISVVVFYRYTINKYLDPYKIYTIKDGFSNYCGYVFRLFRIRR